MVEHSPFKGVALGSNPRTRTKSPQVKPEGFYTFMREVVAEALAGARYENAIICLLWLEVLQISRLANWRFHALWLGFLAPYRTGRSRHHN